MLPSSLALLLLSSLVEQGPGIGWTAKDCGQTYENKFAENPTRCGNLLILEKDTKVKNIVKKLFSLGQSAWEGSFYLQNKKMHTLEKMWQLPSHQRINVGHPDGFADWLAGLTDGDGTFHFRQNKSGSWDFVFKVGASNYNLKLLYYLKKKLKCGSVTPAGKNLSQYRLRHPDILWNFLIPLFDTTEFITDSKTFDYMKFKKALKVYIDWKTGNLDKIQKNILLRELQNEKIDKNVAYAFWKQKPVRDPKKVPSFGWILGFTEAEGSFYLTKVSEKKIVHGAGWIQAGEKELLEQIKARWNLFTNVKLHVNKKCYILDTKSSIAIASLISFFTGKIKGIKAIEFRKWARSFVKHKGDFEKLKKLQDQLRKAKKLQSVRMMVYSKLLGN